MGGKPGAAGDSVQMGSLCRSLPIDDDDTDDSIPQFILKLEVNGE